MKCLWAWKMTINVQHESQMRNIGSCYPACGVGQSFLVGESFFYKIFSLQQWLSREICNSHLECKTSTKAKIQVWIMCTLSSIPVVV
jgi:hypothetical protein